MSVAVLALIGVGAIYAQRIRGGRIRGGASQDSASAISRGEGAGDTPADLLCVLRFPYVVVVLLILVVVFVW